jgi:hypothetical protein
VRSISAQAMLHGATIDSSTGFASSRARVNASIVHGNQRTAATIRQL